MEHRGKIIYLTKQEAELLDSECEVPESDALYLEFAAVEYANVKSDIINDLLSSGSNARRGMIRPAHEKLDLANKLAQELGVVARKANPDLFLPDTDL